MYKRRLNTDFRVRATVFGIGCTLLCAMDIDARYSIPLQKSIIRKKHVGVSKYRNRTDIEVFSGIPHRIEPIFLNQYLNNTKNFSCSRHGGFKSELDL